MTTLRRILKPAIRNRETDWKFTGVVCLVYLALLIWMHIHHEMWRDETHAWSMARTAQGFADLVTGDRRYEGHPPLWFWYLRVWSWFVPRVWGLQAATIVAATGAAALLVRFAPFPRYLKVLLLFSYYFGYEYAVMSRNYTLGWLLLCVFCAAYHPLRLRPAVLAVVLSLLALTSVYGLVMSVALVLFLILQHLRLWSSSPPRILHVSLPSRVIVTALGVFAAVAFCLAYLEPVDTNPLNPAWNWQAFQRGAIPDMLSRVVAGTVPLRRFEIGFWYQSHALWDRHPTWIPYAGAILLGLALLSLLPSWRLALTYLMAVMVMEVIQQGRATGCIRHWGHYLMFLVAGFWLLRTVAPRRKHWASLLLFLSFMPFGIESFLVATVEDTRHVFSGARETAAFIRSQKMEDLPFVGGTGVVLTVAGYLGRPFIASEAEDVNETITLHSRFRPFTVENLLDRAISVARERQSPVLLVSTVELPKPPPNVTASLLFSSHPETISGEVYFVYRLQLG